MADAPRIMVFDRLDRYLFDVDPERLTEASYVEEINGENSLTLVTTQRLEKTNRLITRDAMGTWREYVVLGIEESHDSFEYYCVWSLQYDLSATFINGPYDCGVVPGHKSIPQLPHTAMEVALGDTERWTVGEITVGTMAAASFYRRSGWEGLETVLERWGGELRADIDVEVPSPHGTLETSPDVIVTRQVSLLDHMGSEDATRRFDYGHDLTEIKRTVSDDVWPCRIVPLGKSQETEAGGYTRRPDISSVNNGIMWLQDDTAIDLTRVKNPDGNWEYPTQIVLNETYEEPQDLKDWAVQHITDYTRPRVHYEASVLQFEAAGMSAHGVALGDNVVVVDRDFALGDGLRIDARVTRIKGSLTDPTDLEITIGNDDGDLTSQIAGAYHGVTLLDEQVQRADDWRATSTYVSNLIGRLNASINATGGYSYITEGEGFVTYDRPVSDPTVGAEATKVVEVRGGNIRIADSRTAGGDWDWKTVIQSGHIAANLVTAANLTTGYIGNVNGSYWNLDAGTLYIGANDYIGNERVSDVVAYSQYLQFVPAKGLYVGKSGTTARSLMSSGGFEVIDTNDDHFVHIGYGYSSDNDQPYYLFGPDADYYEEPRAIIVTGDIPGNHSFSVGQGNKPYGDYSFTHGYNCTARGGYAHAEGNATTADGNNSLSLGNATTALGYASLAQGIRTQATNSYAVSLGYETIASGYASFAAGRGSEASNDYSAAIGYNCTASGKNSVALGSLGEASGTHSFAAGNECEARGYACFAVGDGTRVSSNTVGGLACGHYNSTGSSYLLAVGTGADSSDRQNAFQVEPGATRCRGTCYATAFQQTSDRRAKEHIAFLDDLETEWDACEFVRNLAPVLFSLKADGTRHTGFYAQDVQAAEPEGWDTDTVTVGDSMKDHAEFDPLTLDYSALIAPLVTYCHQLERRINELEERVTTLTTGGLT